MTRTEQLHSARRPRWGRSVLTGAVLVPILAISACGSTPTPAAAVATSSSAPVTKLSAAPASTSAPNDAGFDDATRASFQQALDDTRTTGGFPGVIALVQSAQGTWIGTSGTTGEGLEGAPTPTDHTRVGSLTKTMTATVILQLAEEGKLDLSDPIGKYVPGMPNGDTATIQQLAEMTSGIEPYTTSDVIQQQLFADPLRAWTPEELIAFERASRPSFPPARGGSTRTRTTCYSAW